MRGLTRHKNWIACILIIALLGVEASFGLSSVRAAMPVYQEAQDTPGGIPTPFTCVMQKTVRGVSVKVPIPCNSATVTDAPRTIREIVLNSIARTAVLMIQGTFIRQLTNWVRSGFRGSPQFIKDPEAFFKGVVRQGALQHQLNILATQLCYPLGRVGVPGLVLQTPGVAGYPQLRCTMKNRNTQGFFDRFDNGGWQTWSEILQPQNNVYGMSALAQDAGSIRIANSTTQGRDEIIASQGFIGIKKCAVTAAFASVVNGQNFTSSSCAQYQNLTPGSVVAKRINESLLQDVNQWVNVHELSDLIGAVTNLAVNKLIGTKFMCLSCARGGPGQGQTITVVGGAGQQCTDDVYCNNGLRCNRNSNGPCTCAQSSAAQGTCPTNEGPTVLGNNCINSGDSGCGTVNSAFICNAASSGGCTCVAGSRPGTCPANYVGRACGISTPCPVSGLFCANSCTCQVGQGSTPPTCP